MKTLSLLTAAFYLMAPTNTIEHGPVYSGPAPARFVGEGVGTVFFLDDVGKLCSHLPGATVYACSWTNKDGSRIMVLPTPRYAALHVPLGYAAMVEHEIGHWRGWSGQHEE